MMLSIDQIKTCQEYLDQAIVERWKDKLLRGISLVVIVHYSKEDNVYYVLNGNHRLKAYIDLGFSSVPCTVLSDRELSAYLFNV